MEQESHLQRTLRQLMQEQGLSARELSLKCGDNDSLIKSILTGKSRNPRADTLLKLATQLGVTVAYLTGEVGERGSGLAESGGASFASNGSAPFRAAFEIGGRRDLPVRGRAVGGDETWFDFNGEPMDWLFRPPVLNGARDAYAMFVTGSSMEPRYMEGETVYVNPARPVRTGDFVIALLHPKQSGDAARVLVKQLAGRSNGRILLRSLNPPDAPLIDLPAEVVLSLHLIVLSGES